MSASVTIDIPGDARPSPALLGLLCVCSAVGVGHIYFPQALLPQIAASFSVTVDQAALVVTAPQAGFAVGILVIVPFGHTGAYRLLLTILFCCTSIFAVAAALAPSLPVLLAASFLMGYATVAAPVIGPFAAGLSGRGRLGSVTSVLLVSTIVGIVGIVGIVASHAVAGFVAEYSWRYAYAGSAGPALVCAAITSFRLPASSISLQASFPRYLRRPLHQLVVQPELRWSAFYQARIFAGFTAVWATLSLVLGAEFGLRAGTVGWVGFVSLATVVLVPVTGRALDRRDPDVVTTLRFDRHPRRSRLDDGCVGQGPCGPGPAGCGRARVRRLDAGGHGRQRHANIPPRRGGPGCDEHRLHGVGLRRGQPEFLGRCAPSPHFRLVGRSCLDGDPRGDRSGRSPCTYRVRQILRQPIGPPS